MTDSFVTKKSSFHKLFSGEYLFEKDLDGRNRPPAIGQIVTISNTKSIQSYFVDRDLGSDEHIFIPSKGFNSFDQLLKSSIIKAIEYRELFSTNFHNCYRLFYGHNDGIRGLIIDRYNNELVYKSSSQLVLMHLQKFHEILQEQIPNSKLIDIERPQDDVIIELEENSIKFEILLNKGQKLGHFYDHRENRSRFKNLLNKNIIKLTKGLDLFTYTGAWGMTMLKNGVAQVDFVDRADLENVVNKNLNLNTLTGGTFIKSDVFNYLDDAYSKNRTWDVIVSDPPAFIKKRGAKDKAIAGYKKLHEKVLNVAADKSLVIIASCTHYVSNEELAETVTKAAAKVGKVARLLDIGMQGPDHPCLGLNDEQFYIKYLAYYVEAR